MVSARVALARCSVGGGAVTPRWLTARDEPWIAELIELHRALVGEPRRVVRARVDRAVRGLRAPGAALVASVLAERFGFEVRAPVRPAEARAAAFAAACRCSDRGQALALAAGALRTDAGRLERSLFADLPDERRLTPSAGAVSSPDVALRCNLAIAQAALASSSRIAVALCGDARALVRRAHRRGLICTVEARPQESVLAISGPLALFRRTALYGRHLGELLPLFAWSRSFRLEADCWVRGRAGRLVLDPAAPLPPSPEPRRTAGRVEERFARDLRRLTGAWDLVREPEPVAAEGTLIFPDFALVHRGDPSRRWLLEILGFWTAGHVRDRLRRLRAAGLSNLLLCIDATRDCGGEAPPTDARVLRFERRVDAARVLATLEARAPPPRARTPQRRW